jgi:hypothetical protein
MAVNPSSADATIAVVKDKRAFPAATQVLPFTLTLHDVRDVEASIHQVLAETWLRPNRVPVSGQDYIDLVEYLLDVVVRESLKYDPAYGLRFRTILNWRVKQRTVDWLRTNKHDDRSTAPKPTVVAISDLDPDQHTGGFEDHVVSRLAVA